MGRHLFIRIGLFQAAALTLLALSADAREPRESTARILREARQSEVTIHQGKLSCQSGEQNDGQACRLFFENQKGRILELAGNKDRAMRLYLDGKTNVAIEGLVQGPYLRVEEVKAL